MDSASFRAFDRATCVLGALVLGIVLAAVVLPSLPEPRAYSDYADARSFFGIPNFLDVVSNLPFLLVGGYALRLLSRPIDANGAFESASERWPYVVFSLGIALTCIGSIHYHLAPDATRLFWDRLPMTFAFTSLVSAVIVERIGTRVGLRVLLPLLICGVASVVYWRWSVSVGRENLLPYAIVQYGSIAAILIMAMLFPSRYTRGADTVRCIGIYAIAKVAEILDAKIYALGEIVSGHTLKHLLAAFAAYWLVRMLRLRALR